jgi:hypothetical protein
MEQKINNKEVDAATCFLFINYFYSLFFNGSSPFQDLVKRPAPYFFYRQTCRSRLFFADSSAVHRL